MSLTLPTAYSNSSKLGNIQENWIVQLGFYNGDAQGSGEGGWDATLQSGGTANLLNEALDDSETAVDVDDGTVFQVGDYIKVESEIMKVKSISTNTLTVDRGAMSTTAATHNNNTAIYWNNFTPISLADTPIDDVFYHGTITNKPSIRSSIDLANSTAKTGNISLNVINFQFKGDDFSAELFLGTRKYINRDVKIYSQLNGDTALANCLQIYQGRLIDISHDDGSITLQLTEQRPWDIISIPQTKSSNNIYSPVVYGEFTGNSTTSRTSSNNVFPVPRVIGSGGIIYYAMHKTISGNALNLNYYDRNSELFPVLTSSANTTTKNSITVGGIDQDLTRTFRLYGDSLNTEPAEWDDAENALAIANEADVDHQSNTGASYMVFNMPDISGKLSAFKVYVDGSISPDTGSQTVYLKAFIYSTAVTVLTHGDASTLETSGSVNISNSGTDYTIADFASALASQSESPRVVKIGSYTSTNYYDATCKNFWVYAVAGVSTAEPDSAGQERRNLQYIYCGNDGLAESWSGSSGAIQHGHEAHRDLLIRFTGYTTTAPENWSALHTDRHIDTWKIRWWALEPMELKKVLEQLQYEFGFIFKLRADGTGTYIHILQTSELSATQTFTKEDITNLKINNSSFSDLLTKMEINYEKHPAEDRYLSNVTSSNSTARSNWNIQAKENIKEVSFDMNVGTPNTSGQTDGNADFYSYYDNIFGDIKKIISCDIVNPAVGYGLETGDIIQFSNTAGDMPVEPFGDNWADYYMITDLKRSPGKVSITVREVG